MNRRQSQRLRWWFWVVVVFPGIATPFMLATVEAWAPHEWSPNDEHGVLFSLRLSMALILLTNTVCAIAAGMIQKNAHSKDWTGLRAFAEVPLFFVINLVTSALGIATLGRIISAVI